MERGTVLHPDSDEEIGHGTTEAGQLGEILDDVVATEDGRASHRRAGRSRRACSLG